MRTLNRENDRTLGFGSLPVKWWVAIRGTGTKGRFLPFDDFRSWKNVFHLAEIRTTEPYNTPRRRMVLEPEPEKALGAAATNRRLRNCGFGLNIYVDGRGSGRSTRPGLWSGSNRLGSRQQRSARVVSETPRHDRSLNRVPGPDRISLLSIADVFIGCSIGPSNMGACGCA